MYKYNCILSDRTRYILLFYVIRGKAQHIEPLLDHGCASRIIPELLGDGWGGGEMRHQNPPKCTSLLSLKEVPGVGNVLARDIHEILQNLFWVVP